MCLYPMKGYLRAWRGLSAFCFLLEIQLSKCDFSVRMLFYVLHIALPFLSRMTYPSCGKDSPNSFLLLLLVLKRRDFSPAPHQCDSITQDSGGEHIPACSTFSIPLLPHSACSCVLQELRLEEQEQMLLGSENIARSIAHSI